MLQDTSKIILDVDFQNPFLDGTDIKFIYEQLDKSEGTVVSFAKAIARTLKKYLKDEDFKRIESLEGCESGGVGCNVVREDGCIKCLTCGISKC